MGTIRRPPALRKLPEAVGGTAAFHLPSVSFPGTWLCSQSFHYFFSSKALLNSCIYVQMYTNLCTCAYVCMCARVRVCVCTCSTASLTGRPGPLPCQHAWTPGQAGARGLSVEGRPSGFHFAFRARAPPGSLGLWSAHSIPLHLSFPIGIAVPSPRRRCAATSRV